MIDDAIRRLRPSFSSTKPLDIIDINPGPCLWSSKVHDALKPRRHVLVEPDRNTYKSYVDPLLEQKDSRYRHVPHLSDLFGARGAEYLPDQTPVTPRISGGTLNDTLLIVANLTGPKAFRSQRGSSILAMHHYINGMMNQENSFHHYGLVRMLAWLPDDEKTSFLPRNVTERRKFTVRLDMGAQVEEIVGADEVHSPSQSRRQHDLTIKSEQLASLRGIRAGIWHPESRRPHPSTRPWYEIGLVPDAIDQLRRLPNKLPWQSELLALEDTWNARRIHLDTKPRKGDHGRGRPPSKEPESLRLHRAKFLTMRKANTIPQQWAHRQNELVNAQCDLVTGDPSSPDHISTREAIQAELAQLHAEMAKGRRDLVVVARKYIDDCRGFKQQPPLLQWDRRTGEPLIVTDDEFYPSKKMALLDINPTPEALQQLSDFDKRVCFDYLCNMLFRNPAQPISDNLATVVRGGLDDFVQRIPDLLNPLKGGHANLDDLRARAIPASLLIQLALALETWPFRMQTHAMIMTTGTKRLSLTRENARVV